MLKNTIQERPDAAKKQTMDDKKPRLPGSDPVSGRHLGMIHVFREAYGPRNSNHSS